MESFNQTDIAIIISKMGSVWLWFVHVLKVGNTTLKTHLNNLQEAGGWCPPSQRCLLVLALHAHTAWHWDTAPPSYQAFSVETVLAGSPKPVIQRVEFGTVRSPRFTATSPVAWRSCVSVSSMCMKYQHSVEREAVIFLEHDHMCLETISLNGEGVFSESFTTFQKLLLTSDKLFYAHPARALSNISNITSLSIYCCEAPWTQHRNTSTSPVSPELFGSKV